MLSTSDFLTRKEMKGKDIDMRYIEDICEESIPLVTGFRLEIHSVEWVENGKASREELGIDRMTEMLTLKKQKSKKQYTSIESIHLSKSICEKLFGVIESISFEESPLYQTGLPGYSYEITYADGENYAIEARGLPFRTDELKVLKGMLEDEMKKHDLTCDMLFKELDTVDNVYEW